MPDGRYLAEAIDHLGAGLLLIDRNMRVVWHNAVVARKLARQSIRDLICYDAAYSRAEPCSQCLVTRTFETGQPQRDNVTMDVPGHGRLTFSVSTTPVASLDGQVTQVLEMVHDITEARSAESRVARYKRLTDNSEDYMAACDENGSLLVVNRRVTEGLGYSEAELFGRPFVDLVPESDRQKVRSILDRARAFGVAIDTLRLLRKDDRALPTYVFVTFDPADKVYETICRDISERLKMEDELRKRGDLLEEQNTRAMRAVEEKDRFCRVISHELRTPLTSIIGFTEMLLEDDEEPLTESQRAKMAKVTESARKLLEMVNGLLDLSKLDACMAEVELSRVRLDQLLEQVVDGLQPLAKDKPVCISVETEQVLPEVVTDRQKLTQIVVNLLSNAIKFTHEGSVCVSAARRDDCVHISVRDTGIGIPAADLPHVFKEFHRVHRPGQRQPGTGLGLAIAQRLAKVLGGEISVSSKENAGSTFTVRIPISPEPALDRILRSESDAA